MCPIFVHYTGTDGYGRQRVKSPTVAGETGGSLRVTSGVTNLMAIELPHLSTRCPTCGDHTSMPPACDPVKASEISRLNYSRTDTLFAVLHLCTNSNCSGATVGYYSYSRNQGYRYEFHRPEFDAYEVPEEVPKRPRAILQDANDARKTPVACTAAAVRAVEAMLAEEGYCKRSMSLKKRIDTAVDARALPPAMGDWANEVREIGRETHTDESPAPLPKERDAKHALLFANTLAQYLFVLPARISKARKPAKKK